MNDYVSTGILKYPLAEFAEVVKIRPNQALFTKALVMCHKPETILEFGFGAGESTRAILSGLEYNRSSFDYTVVDNWQDLDGIRHPATFEEQYKTVKFVTKREYDFVQECQLSYDFIFSDGDHTGAPFWFDKVFTNLLRKDGVLIYHDITSDLFPNLDLIYRKTLENGYHHILFNKNSFPDENCESGMLVIFKH